MLKRTGTRLASKENAFSHEPAASHPLSAFTTGVTVLHCSSPATRFLFDYIPAYLIT